MRRIDSGGYQYVFASGGIASVHDLVLNDGYELVEPDGKASGTIVSSGGTAVVHVGGTATGATISNAGILGVSGTVSGTTIDSGGTLELLATTCRRQRHHD